MAHYLFGNTFAFVAAFALLFQTTTTTAQKQSETFAITISLPSESIHLGDELVVNTITSNPTDHVVYAGEGRAGGIALELLDNKGKDIGRHAMGKYKEGEEYPVISNRRETLNPGRRREVTWRWQPDLDYLAPGVYKLRVYRKDVGAGIEVYSNAVTLTVLP